MASPLLEKAENNLQRVVNGQSKIDDEVLCNATDYLTYSNEVLTNEDEILASLVPLIIQVLQISNEDLTSTLGFLKALLMNKEFEQITKFLSLEMLEQGLFSPISSLQEAVVHIIGDAKPADIVANTPLVKDLVLLLQKPNASVVHKVHTALSSLAKSGELVRRRLFQDQDVYSNLLEMKESNDALIESKVMDLIQDVMLAPGAHIPLELVKFKKIETEDFMQTANRIHFYKTLLENPHPHDLVTNLADQIKEMAELYQKRQQDPMIMLVVPQMESFWATMSSTEESTFKLIDDSYGICKDANYTFISTLDPLYLAKNHPNIVRSVPFNSQGTKALQRLLLYKPSFDIVQPTETKILSLGYLEQMVLTAALTSTSFGYKFILEQAPGIINSLLEPPGELRDDQVLIFRKEAIGKLIDRLDDGPIRSRLKAEFDPSYNNPDLPVQVATQSAQ